MYVYSLPFYIHSILKRIGHNSTMVYDSRQKSLTVLRLLVWLRCCRCPMAFTQHATTAARRLRPMFIVPTEKEREYETRNLIRSIEDEEPSGSHPVDNRALLGVACTGFVVGALAMDSDDMWTRFAKGLFVATAAMGCAANSRGAATDLGSTGSSDAGGGGLRRWYPTGVQFQATRVIRRRRRRAM